MLIILLKTLKWVGKNKHNKKNKMSILINEFCHLIQNDLDIEVDILEFGTGGARSTKIIAELTNEKKIITFDGFVGLPKTEKGIPKGTGWDEGNLKFDYENAVTMLAKHEKVKVHKCMSWELTNPSDYGINKVSSVNFDFDLYEGTLDALRFVQKCEWNKIIFRLMFFKNISINKSSAINLIALNILLI